ncbi:hypothetical protein HIM_04426 [Hirsutella minnesotensis 3608]|uniref:Major facilitator superfamily (MFS) profile domain-containing protein n=1 Tax=Hirsutella minnesotensis 3608 TaxID=1043627 RepID=A0A0F8A626_9HYPO|nr:hypothetical protein HIM_04426 [Hirsutella minnesotensis 3608]
MNPDDDAERRPLLPPADDNGMPASTAGKQSLTLSQRLAVAVPCLVIIFAAEIGASMIAAPMSQIAEGVICRRFHPDVVDPTTDARCKNADVQAELAMLQGWGMTFALIPGLLMAVPYGMLADRYGRKVILCLSLFGMLLVQMTDVVIFLNPESFHYRLVWLDSLWIFIGGGPVVYMALLFTMANDVSTETQRSTTFFYLAAATIGGELASGPLAYVSMRNLGAWSSVFIGIMCLAAAALIAFAVPETRQPKAKESDAECRGQDVRRPVSESLRRRLSDGVKRAAASARRLFWDNRTLGLLLFSLLFSTLGKYVSLILKQYTAKRFQWSWSEAALLSSISAAVNLGLVAVVLPAASQVLLTRLHYSPSAKDMLMVRSGIVASVVGAFTIGLAPGSAMLVVGVVVFALGYGYGPAMRGLLVVVAGDDDVGTLFTAMSVLESAGVIVSGPLMAAAFNVGLSWGEFWTGLPFLAAGCLLSVAALIVFGVGVQEAETVKTVTVLNAEGDDISG